jgi:adenylate kinase
MRDAALLLGRQGSGKGTVGRFVAREGLVQFASAGEILRIAARADTPKGRRIKKILKDGVGVPPHESYPLVAHALERLSAGNILLDGCPRRINEVGRVADLFSRQPQLVVELDVPLPIALARLQARRTCQTCEAPYGPAVPTEKGRCTACGGAVTKREDDSIEAIAKRLETWDVEGRKIIRYYDERTTVVRIDGARSPAAVAAEVGTHMRSLSGD